MPLSFGNSWNRKCTASLDRIDSAKGYVEGNVQWVHKRINLMKGTLSEKDFIAFCQMVVTYGRASPNPLPAQPTSPMESRL